MKKTFLLLIVLSIATAGCAKSSTTPDLSTIRSLVINRWGDCGSGRCRELQVNLLEKKDEAWFAEVIFRGMADDSVEAERKVITVYFAEDKWRLGELRAQEWICQPGRGQQQFSADLCS